MSSIKMTTVKGHIVPLTQLPTVLSDASSSTISLVLLFGSWNNTSIVNTNACEILMQLFQETLQAFQQQQQYTGQLVAIQVDENEDTLCQLCDVDSVFESDSLESSSHISTLQAPSELPALVLCVAPFKNTWVPVHIQSNILSSVLLSATASASAATQQQSQLQDAIQQGLQESLGINDWIPKKKHRDTMDDDTAKNKHNIPPPLPLHVPPTTSHWNEDSHNDNTDTDTTPLRIFVAGDKTQVGKSTICLGLLGTLLHHLHYHPRELAYIKPATQCEASTLVAQYCAHHGIDAVPIGPLVYYKGFTRSFLLGELMLEDEKGDKNREMVMDSNSLLQQISNITDALANGTSTTTTTPYKKKVVIIDGVGYPAVGSICGTDNADVARACGYLSLINDDKNHVDSTGTSTPHSSSSSCFEMRRPVPVLLVGKNGMGDAIDSYNLNATYFTSKHVPVMGAIFNRFSTNPNDYYNMERCKESIQLYFQRFKENEQVFGFLPELVLESEALPNSLDDDDTATENMNRVHSFISLFSSHVNVQGILESAKALSRQSRTSSDRNLDLVPIEKKLKMTPDKDMTIHPSSSRVFLSRAEIEATAQRLGAASG